MYINIKQQKQQPQMVHKQCSAIFERYFKTPIHQMIIVIIVKAIWTHNNEVAKSVSENPVQQIYSNLHSDRWHKYSKRC